MAEELREKSIRILDNGIKVSEAIQMVLDSNPVIAQKVQTNMAEILIEG